MKLNFDYVSILGRRATQEDAEVVYDDQSYQIAAVFDGHGGDQCSTYCQNNYVQTFLDEVRKSGGDV